MMARTQTPCEKQLTAGSRFIMLRCNAAPQSPPYTPSGRSGSRFIRSARLIQPSRADQTLTGCRSGSATCCCDCTKSMSLLRALTYARALPTTTSSCAAEAAKLRCAVLPCKMVEQAVNSSYRYLMRFHSLSTKRADQQEGC